LQPKLLIGSTPPNEKNEAVGATSEAALAPCILPKCFCEGMIAFFRRLATALSRTHKPVESPKTPEMMIALGLWTSNNKTDAQDSAPCACTANTTSVGLDELNNFCGKVATFENV
jgi:hypothetical protein